MPLVLSMRETHDFYVAAEQLVVDVIHDDASFTLRLVSTGKKFLVSDQDATEVLPDVFVSSGGFQNGGLVRVAIEAPHSIFILRGDLYRSGTLPKRKRA